MSTGPKPRLRSWDSVRKNRIRRINRVKHRLKSVPPRALFWQRTAPPHSQKINSLGISVARGHALRKTFSAACGAGHAGPWAPRAEEAILTSACEDVLFNLLLRFSPIKNVAMH